MEDSETDFLCCADLACGYAGATPVLEDVQLRHAPRRILAILGGSGSGKSTLLRTLAGLQPPLSGRVRLLGRDPYALAQAERRRLMRRTGFLFQHDALFGSLTLLENVMLPLRELTRMPSDVMCEVARVKLGLVDLAELEHRLPSQVSGGQRKRAALARATVLDPLVLFCDEPTSGLDPGTAGQIDELLMRTRDALRVSIVLVTHDIDGARTIADHAVVVGAGGIRAAGQVRELEQNESDPVVSALFRRDASYRNQKG